MPEDDDINYVILALKILEKYGLKFTSDNVAERWLNGSAYSTCFLWGKNCI